MSAERHLRVFKNGRSRAVRIPRELDIFGEELVMRRDGERVIMERPKQESLAEILAKLGPITDEEWPDIDDPSPEPVEFP